MRVVVAVLVALVGFLLAPLAFDDSVAVWSDVLSHDDFTTSSATRSARSVLAVDEAPQTTWTGRCEPGDWISLWLTKPIASACGAMISARTISLFRKPGTSSATRLRWP